MLLLPCSNCCCNNTVFHTDSYPVYDVALRMATHATIYVNGPHQHLQDHLLPTYPLCLPLLKLLPHHSSSLTSLLSAAHLARKVVATVPVQLA
jgi:hypothetical protein